MTKSEQVQAILDRTVKDITAIKAIYDNDLLMSDYIDLSANKWLLCLHSLAACYKSDDI